MSPYAAPAGHRSVSVLLVRLTEPDWHRTAAAPPYRAATREREVTLHLVTSTGLPGGRCAAPGGRDSSPPPTSPCLQPLVTCSGPETSPRGNFFTKVQMHGAAVVGQEAGTSQAGQRRGPSRQRRERHAVSEARVPVVSAISLHAQWPVQTNLRTPSSGTDLRDPNVDLTSEDWSFRTDL